MIKKYFKTFLLPILLVFIQDSIPAEPLNLPLFIDRNYDLANFYSTGKPGAVYAGVKTAIKQYVPFLASSNLLIILMQKDPYLFKQLTDDNQWSVFLDDKDEYTVVLPKKYSSDLEKIGLNKNKIAKEPSNRILSVYKSLSEKEIKVGYSIDLDALKSIFAEKTGARWEPVNYDVKKRFFLNGHGGHSPSSIAGFTTSQYRDFLQFLNILGTDLLYVSSCYSGGGTLLRTYQSSEEEISKPLSLNYFIIVGAVTDAAAITYEGALNFNKFFAELNNFFSSKKNKASDIANIIKPIWAGIQNNIASIRFPGSLNYFKVADIDKNIDIITYAKETARALSQSIPSSSENKPVLLYPIYIKNPLSLSMLESKLSTRNWYSSLLFSEYPGIVSMIPGQATHVISKINAFDDLDLQRLLLMFFAVESVSPKLFLIENVSTRNYAGSGIDFLLSKPLELKNVMIYKNSLKKSGKVILTVNGTSYIAKVEYSEKSRPPEVVFIPIIQKFNRISSEAAQKEIHEMILKTQASLEAIIQSSGGQEEQEKILKAATKKFTPSYSK